MSGRPSDVRRLPDELRKMIERRLSERGFIDYEGLAGEIRQHGYEVSAASLRRFGTARPRLSRPRRRSSTLQRSADEALLSDSAMTETLVQLTQEKLRSVLARIKQLKQADMSRLAHAVAHLTQAAISLRRWTDEHRQLIEMGESEDSDQKSKSRRGLSTGTSQSLRNALLGIAPSTTDLGGSPDATPADDTKRPLASFVADELDSSDGAYGTALPGGEKCDPGDDDTAE